MKIYMTLDWTRAIAKHFKSDRMGEIIPSSNKSLVIGKRLILILKEK